MAAFTIEVRSSATGPAMIVTGPTGHTITINDYAHPTGQPGTPIVDQHNRPGKQIVFNL